jgi:hypothetical protein
VDSNFYGENENMKTLLSSPIYPAKGAANLELNDPESEVIKVMGQPIGRVTTCSNITRMDYGSIAVWIGPDKKVQQIGLYDGYQGQTPDGVFIGMDADALRKLWGHDLAYVEDGKYWEFLSRPGTLFDLEKKENGRFAIKAIYIAR